MASAVTPAFLERAGLSVLSVGASFALFDDRPAIAVVMLIAAAFFVGAALLGGVGGSQG